MCGTFLKKMFPPDNGVLLRTPKENIDLNSSAVTVSIWSFFAPQQRVLVPKNCTSLVSFHLLALCIFCSHCHRVLFRLHGALFISYHRMCAPLFAGGLQVFLCVISREPKTGENSDLERFCKRAKTNNLGNSRDRSRGFTQVKPRDGAETRANL